MKEKVSMTRKESRVQRRAELRRNRDVGRVVRAAASRSSVVDQVVYPGPVIYGNIIPFLQLIHKMVHRKEQRRLRRQRLRRSRSY